MTIKPVQKNVIVFLVILAAALSLLSYPFIKHMSTRAVKFDLTDDYQRSEDFDGIVYYRIDRLERDNLTPNDDGSLSNADPNYFVIEGWSGVANESVEIFNTHVLLLKDDSSVCYKLRTAMNSRDDLSDYAGNGFSYKDGGFVARVDSRTIPDGNYQVLILYQNDYHDFVIYTDTFIEVN